MSDFMDGFPLSRIYLCTMSKRESLMSRMNWSAGFRSTNRALLQNPLPIGKKPNTKRNSISEGGLIPEWSPFQERSTILEHTFWTALDKLVEQSEIIIDRPKGSVHPVHPDLSIRWIMDF